MSSISQQGRDRRRAVVVGLLFISAIVTLFIGQALYGSTLNSAEYLETVQPHRNQVIIGVLIEFLGIIGLAFIPVLLFPYLKRRDEMLARGYVGIRLLEVVLLSLAQIWKLRLVDLSRAYSTFQGDASPYLEAIGASIKSALFWNDSGGLMYLVVFVIGMLIIYTALYRSRLIPRWLSVWGLIAAGLLLISSVTATFNLLPEMVAVLLMVATPLQELAMSLWFIVKGFNPKAVLQGATA
jgi:hypothetical protein